MKRLALLLALANLVYFAWWHLYPPHSMRPVPAPPSDLPLIRLSSEVDTSPVPNGGLPALSAREETPSREVSAPAESATEATISAAPAAPVAEMRPLHEAGSAAQAGRMPPPDVGPLTEAGSAGAGGSPPPSAPRIPAEAADEPEAVAGREVAARCFTLGPFDSRSPAETLAARLAAAGHHAEVREKSEEVVAADYWVYLPARTLEEARALLARVVAKGITDRYLDSKRHLVSLGIYTYRNMAERRRQELEALGFSPRLEPRTRRRMRYWVFVTPSQVGLSREALEELAGEAVPILEVGC